MNIAILYGGKSGEHEVSLVSASSIARNIPEAGNTVHLIGITKKGAWYLQDQKLLEEIRSNPKAVLSISESESRRVAIVPGGGVAGAFRLVSAAGVAGAAGLNLGVDGSFPVDVAFPVLHGTFGEDGTIQGLFEMAEIPYVGGGVLASSIAMDKEKAKVLWRAAGLPIVPFVAARMVEWNDPATRNAIVRKAENELFYPLFVKPACAGSSVGAAKAANREELEKRASEAFQWDDKILIEPFMPAREIECSVTGNSAPVAYTPGEIIPTHEFYDYDAKYTDPDGASLRIPADLSEDMTKRVRQTACEAYRTLELSGLSRVDFFVDKRDGALYINEINTIPGFTSISMFPKMCEASGLPYAELVMRLLRLAKDRFTERRNLQTSRP
ncbi:MAG TPA: D-alanine--D-alanine ligase family protein [Treponemataceae bacterium]|nr:D-alanine--D-alanine ligase family protein [Treponemataceae bacterium]